MLPPPPPEDDDFLLPLPDDDFFDEEYDDDFLEEPEPPPLLRFELELLRVELELDFFAVDEERKEEELPLTAHNKRDVCVSLSLCIFV